MTADEQITSLLEVITFIIKRLSNEEARSIKSTTFSDYFRKHLNLLDERKKENEGEKSEKKRAVCLTPKKKLDDVHENINIQQKEHRKGMTIVKVTKDNIETNSKRPKLDQIPPADRKKNIVLKVQTLDSLEDKRKNKENMVILNESIFNTKQPKSDNQTIKSNLEQLNSVKTNEIIKRSSGPELEIDNVMSVVNAPVEDVRNMDFSCIMCDCSYASVMELSQHDREEHLSEDRYICPVCCSRNRRKEDLLMHYSIVHHYGRKCQSCGIYFSTKSEMKNHYCRPLYEARTAQTNIYHQCKLCKAGLPGYEALRAHYAYYCSRRDKMKSFCFLCDKFFVKTKIHFCYTVKGKNFVCNLCRKNFDSLESLMPHFDQEHRDNMKLMRENQEYRDKVKLMRENQEPKMSCPSCEEVFDNSDFLLGHIKEIHEKDDNMILEYSGAKIEGTYQVTQENNHDYSDISGTNLTCRVCGMKFGKIETLKAHENLHENK